jgi:hypothetical protein
MYILTAIYVRFQLGVELPIFKDRLKHLLEDQKSFNTPDWQLDEKENGVSLPLERKPPRPLNGKIIKLC